MHLDTEADSDEAFRMILQSLQPRGESSIAYRPPTYYDPIGHAKVHAEVYAMADRLLMLDLKESAMKNMLMCLSLYRSDKRRAMFTIENGGFSSYKYDIHVPGVGKTAPSKWVHDPLPYVDGLCVARILEIIYTIVPTSHDIKDLVMIFSTQNEVFRELATCAKYAALLGNDELRVGLERGVREQKSFTFSSYFLKARELKLSSDT